MFIRHLEKLQEQLSDYILDTLKYTATVKEFGDKESKWTLQRETELEMMRDIKDRADQITLKFEHVQKAEKKTKAFGEYLLSSLTQRRWSLLPAESQQCGSLGLPAGKIHPRHSTDLSRSISGSEGVPEWINGKSSVKLNFIMSEEQKHYNHLLQLNKIRMDESFRLTFLFGVKAQDFIKLFSEHQTRMLQFLCGLDEAANQLNKMKLGSNISTVAGSSVGIAGGVLSIVGLALAPVTAGVSLTLTLTGVGLGVTSGVNSVVTGITEMAVNNHHGNNANNIFIRFMEDVKKIQDCLEEVASRESPIVDNVLTGVKALKLAACAGAVGKGIDALVDVTSAVKALRSKQIIAEAANVGLQEAKAVRNIPQLAADLPDIGQMAKGTPLALSNSARAGFIGLNVLFIGLDVLFICKDSISLSKGSKNEVAQVIRSRSVLWRSEVEAWKKIHDHLCDATLWFYNNQEILEQPFLP
ncbi:apolipoprotein L5-like isoform X2 [Tachysurus ichikawai]